MTNQTGWELAISLNNAQEPTLATLPNAASHITQTLHNGLINEARSDLISASRLDPYPLPLPQDREGYYADNHFAYWRSGLDDANSIMSTTQKLGLRCRRFLDFGCSSGRLTRHLALQFPNLAVLGCDINRHHVEWCNAHLPLGITTFQNTSIPTLPLESESIDVVSAFSVFTHIESFETNWLMEIRRVLKPGGIFWVTFHSELTLKEMDETWPLWKPVMDHPEATNILAEDRSFSGNRLILRWDQNSSYSSNVFYKISYLTQVWGRYFTVAELRRRGSVYQDVLVLMKEP